MAKGITERKSLYRFVAMAATGLVCITATTADAQSILATNDLTTSWGRAVTPENVWREYPRPQLVRGEWASLNGKWEIGRASCRERV